MLERLMAMVSGRPAALTPSTERALVNKRLSRLEMRVQLLEDARLRAIDARIDAQHPR